MPQKSNENSPLLSASASPEEARNGSFSAFGTLEEKSSSSGLGGPSQPAAVPPQPGDRRRADTYAKDRSSWRMSLDGHRRAFSEVIRERVQSGLTIIHHHLYEGTVPGTIINTLCNVVGGGVLAIPLAFCEASLINGIIMTFMCATVAIYNVYCLVQVCDRFELYTFNQLLQKAFPKLSFAGLIGTVFVFFNSFGILVLYTKVIGDSIPPVCDQIAGGTGLWSHPLLWMSAASVVFVGLTCARNLSELRFTSALGFLTVFYIVVMVVVRFADHSYDHFASGSHQTGPNPMIARDVTWFAFAQTMLKTFPTLSVAYNYHYNVPTYYMELIDRRPRTMMKTVAGSFPVITSIYLLVGLLGVFTFGDAEIMSKKAGGSLLNNYRTDDLAFNIGRLGMFLHFLCVFPMLSVAARKALDEMIFGQRPFVKMPIIFVESLVLVGTVFTVAVFVPGIAFVVDLFGSVFGISVTITLPSLIYVMVFRDSEDVSPARKVLTAGIVVFGVMLSCAGLATTIQSQVQAG